MIFWLVLRGHCPNCSTPIGVRYLVVEVACGVLFAPFTALVWGLDPLLPALLVFVWSLPLTTDGSC